MSQAYCGYSLREVQLNGDRFLLTIPPVHMWKQLLAYRSHDLIEIKEWEISCNAFLFDEDPNSGELSIISTRDADTTLCRYQRGQSPMDGVLSMVELKFWPCLIPLTRTGEVDESFRSMDGLVIEGGFFELGRSIIKKTGSPVVGHSPRPAVWTFRSFRSLELLDTCDDPKLNPLRWCVCNGVLMGMQALIQIDLKHLIDFGMVPR